MSKNYAKVKYFYEHGLWSKQMVKNAVDRWITTEEYELVTSETYQEV